MQIFGIHGSKCINEIVLKSKSSNLMGVTVQRTSIIFTEEYLSQLANVITFHVRHYQVGDKTA